MKKGLLLLAILVLLSWGVYECKYYYSYWQDLRDRPWAYSEDKNTPLLVGQWQGTFKDPQGIEKTIKLTIEPPTTDEERERKASQRSRRRGYSRQNKQVFDGTATVMSRVGVEQYELNGAVEKEDFHQFHCRLHTQDGTKQVLPNFALSEVEEANWQNDELKMSLRFVYFNPDGSTTSSSTGVVRAGKIVWKNSSDDQTTRLTLHRVESMQ